MRNDLGLFVSFVLLILGGRLLYQGVSDTKATELSIILGAVLVTLSLLIMWSALKSWLAWKRG
jgi:hypothetical protein